MKIVQTILHPPEFADKDKTRTAVLLHFILVFSLILDVLTGLGMLWASDLGLVGLEFNAAVGVILGGLLWLLYWGKVRLTGVLTSALFWLAISSMAASDSGIFNPIFSGFLVVIVVAGLVVDGWAAIFFAALSSFVGLVFVYAAEQGLYISLMGDTTARIAWVDYTAIFVMETICLLAGLRILNRAYKRISRSEERFRALIERSSDLIVITGRDGTIQFVSPSVETILGYTPDEFIGKSGISFIHQDDSLAVSNRSPRLANDPGGIRHSEYRIQHKDGSYRILEMVVRNMLHIPEVEGLVVNARDVTERVQAEEAMRRSEELFSKIFQSVPIVIGISTAKEGRLLKINDYGLSLSGYKAEELIGRLTSEIAIWPTPLRNEEQFQNEIRKHGAAHSMEVVWKTKSGDTLDMVVSLLPIELDGELCFLTIGLDVTARKQAEKERLEAEKMRMEVYKEREILDLKEQFISTMSHEFRTPLSVILSATSSLETYYDRLTPERRKEHLQNITDQAHYATHLLDDVLKISAARSGKLAFIATPFDLVAFCQSRFDQIQATDKSNHRFAFVHQGQLSDFVGDDNLLQHILINLLSNAIKYSPNGGEVRLELSRDGDNAIIHISDEGIGIPEEDQRHLFELFYRASNTKAIEGTGLGLAIVKESVEIHGGSIDWESTAGKGTAFIVRLPMHPSH